MPKPVFSARSGVAAGALLLVAGVAACSKASAPPPPPPVEVTLATITPRAATVTIEYVGELEAINTAEIRPRVGGLLEKQAALEGESVKRGQVLFRIDPQPYVAALANAKATLAQAQAALDQAERDLSRVQPLSQINAVSQQEYDAVVARTNAGKASVEAARAGVQTAQLNLDYTTVTSPIDGLVGRALFRTGGLVTAYSSLLTTVYATDSMYVNFSISEQRMLELQRQWGARVPAGGVKSQFKLLLADGSEYPQPAKLNLIDAAVDKTTGTLPVRLEVPNPDGLLRAGQFARVVVAAQNLPDAILVPQKAVQELQGKTYVWRVDGEGKAQSRDVRMGPRIGNDWLVQEGLAAGDRIVVDGFGKVKPGAIVADAPAQPAAAPPPKG
jgi:membrane fusion protein (multidrug efflux system)